MGIRSATQAICNCCAITALIALLTAPGCGGFPTQTDNPSLVLSDVDRVELVTLDWSGGYSDLYPDMALQGIDFGKFVLADGGTLADQEDKFKAAVVDEIIAILDELPQGRVHVRNGRAQQSPSDTIIHLAQSFSPQVGGQIGQAIYDPCDRYTGDSGIIYGEEILQTGGPFYFEEWVMMFANVTAHEIAHTLGYGHVERVLSYGADRPLYVELMLAIHTVPEMISPQRYLATDGNCPDSSSSKSIGTPDEICGITHD